MTRRYVLMAAGGGLAWATLLQGLGGVGLLGPDEPRYAQVASEMLARHDWITPHLWGAPWFEKPVLLYWLEAAAQTLLGRGEAAARLPNAVLAVLLSLGLYLFLRRTQSERAGVLAAALSLSCAGMIGFGRAASTDMTLTAPLGAGLMALYCGRRSGRDGWYAAAAAALGLATLAKGPVAVVLAGAAWLAYLALQRDLGGLRKVLAPAPIAVYVAVAAPWYALVWLRNPEFGRVFFLQHNLERFATGLYQHPEPFWYYLPVLGLALLPWTAWLLPPLLRWRERRCEGLYQFLGLWLLAPLLFFSISRSKLPGYLLPAVPAAVMLMAVEADRRWDALPRWLPATNAAAVALLPAALQLLPRFFVTGRLRSEALTMPTLGPAALAGAMCALALAALVWRRRTTAVMAATCILVAGAGLAATHPPLSDTLDLYASARPAAPVLEQAFAGRPVYAWNLNRSMQYGIQYYLDRPLPPWDGGGPSGAVVIMDADRLQAFRQQFGGTAGIWELPHTALVEVR